MSFCASFMVAMLAGPRYAMEPVSGNRPAAMNVSDFALPDEPDAAESAVPDEPQPASAMTAAATMAVAVMDSFLMPFMLIFFI